MLGGWTEINFGRKIEQYKYIQGNDIYYKIIPFYRKLFVKKHATFINYLFRLFIS